MVIFAFEILTITENTMLNIMDAVESGSYS